MAPTAYNPHCVKLALSGKWMIGKHLALAFSTRRDYGGPSRFHSPGWQAFRTRRWLARRAARGSVPGHRSWRASDGSAGWWARRQVGEVSGAARVEVARTDRTNEPRTPQPPGAPGGPFAAGCAPLSVGSWRLAGHSEEEDES